MAHLLIRRPRVLMLILFLGASCLPAVVRAQGPDAASIRVQIENIQHKGNDAYRIAVSTSNSSSANILISIIEEGFFIQTDRGWSRLTLKEHVRDSGEFRLPSAGISDRSATLSIPLSLPGLFRTYEGDLSLMYKYAYSVREADGAGAAFRKADEVYCWVKPGTSQWILREGM